MRKNRIKIQTKLYTAALEVGSATKICGHVDEYVRKAHAKFHENRRNGLGVTGRRLLKSSFSLRKSNGQYIVGV